MEKYSLLTKLAKCTLNIALKLTFSVFLFFFVFWLHFRPPRHCLRPFLERQFFTQMTVERREEKVGKPLLTGSALFESYHLIGPSSRQLCQQLLCVANEMRVLQLHVQVSCSWTVCGTSSYHTEISHPFTTSTNRMNWKADLTTFTIRTSWNTPTPRLSRLEQVVSIEQPHRLVAIC